MGLIKKPWYLSKVIVLLSIVVFTIPNVQAKAVGKESRLTLNELRQRYESVKSKGNVDPNSDVVNLLESMFVDEGNRHDLQPEGIGKIASKKGKVFGDTHDSHKLTQDQIDELKSGNGKGKRNFWRDARLWTDKIIPYTIASSLSSVQGNVDTINKAIQQFTDYTCLRWVPYGSAEANQASYPNYVEFFSGRLLVVRWKSGIRQTRNQSSISWLCFAYSTEAGFDLNLNRIQSNLLGIESTGKHHMQVMLENCYELRKDDGKAKNISFVIEFISCFAIIFYTQEVLSFYFTAVNVSTTVHEMAHAIGQFHEQSRNDRDNHVTMVWSNIDNGQNNNNMQKHNTFDYNPYDYQSVLQYSLTSFSINGQAVMKFHDRRLEFLADSATGLMFYDIQDVTDAYDCTRPCRGPSGTDPLKQCQNGGFVIHTCDCLCPYGITGDLCQTVGTDPECGPGLITLADGETKTITTPNFNTGGPYPTGKRCVWLVKSSSGKNVAMKIDEMDLSTDDGACAHWLEIQYNLIGQGGPKRCGKFSHETYVTSDSGNPSMMLLMFNSSFAPNVQAGKGFTLSVSSVGAGCKSAPCVFGTCADVGSSDFNCACASGYTGRLCDTLVGSGDTVCDFEGGVCGFSNLKSDSYDWVIKS
ncbi:protein SpAN-like, partial [Saccostrea cucullata]|uniref:protein SpAN-like n=1 Tax=Saccostrea cuccullata TaxID=36930 RepID=UPI002ED1DF03